MSIGEIIDALNRGADMLEGLQALKDAQALREAAAMIETITRDVLEKESQLRASKGE